MPPERARPKRVGSAQKRPSPRGARRGCPSRASDAGWRAIRATRHPRRRPREGGARRGAGHAWATYDLGLSGFPLPKGQTNARTPPSYKCLPPLHTNVVFLSFALASSFLVGRRGSLIESQVLHRNHSATWAARAAPPNTQRATMTSTSWRNPGRLISAARMWKDATQYLGLSQPPTSRCTAFGQAFPHRKYAAGAMTRILPIAKRRTSFFPASCRASIDLAPSFTVWDAKARQAAVGDLAKHEYKKHGTCSGLPPDAYFSEAVRAFAMLPGQRGTPEVLTKAVGGSVATAALRAAYSKRVALSADKQCRPTEVTTCWEKRPDGRVGKQIDCPEHVMNGRDRGHQCASLRITQLGQCLAGDGGRKGDRDRECRADARRSCHGSCGSCVRRRRSSYSMINIEQLERNR